MIKPSRKDSVDLLTLVKKEDLFYLPNQESLFNGYYYWHYENGIIAEEGHIKNGKYHGKIKLFNEDGNLLVNANYRNGKKYGFTQTFYSSGQLKAEFT
ncbi:MAG TPA: hypothetical protein VJ346_09345, partial [Bacteroidales bacterium]|nr:hypothetical protein [Bacteroidales bacterium]